MMNNSRSPEQWLLLFVRDPSYAAKALTDPLHRDHRYMLQQFIKNDILAHPRDADFEVFEAHMRIALETPNHPDQQMIAEYERAVADNFIHPYHQPRDVDATNEVRDISYNLRDRPHTHQRGTGL